MIKILWCHVQSHVQQSQILFFSLVVKEIKETPDFLQALTNKGVNLVERKFFALVSKSLETSNAEFRQNVEMSEC